MHVGNIYIWMQANLASAVLLEHCVPLQGHTCMQYHPIVMVLAEYSSSYSLFACHMMLAASILTLLKLSNMCSSLTLAPKCPTFT